MFNDILINAYSLFLPFSSGVSSYMLNDRLFPMHMSSQSHSPSNCCPTCEDRPTRTQPPRRCVRCVYHEVSAGILLEPGMLCFDLCWFLQL